MLAQGIIEPSISAYGSPIVIVKKTDGTPRFCVDYRRFNSLTTSEATPMPGSATVFSTIDLKTGYWQIPVERTSQHPTAFATPDGATYHFRVMPFGLKNRPGIFQRLKAQEVLAVFLHRFIIVYLDDIIIFSRDWPTHLHHIILLFE